MRNFPDWNFANKCNRCWSRLSNDV